MQAAPYTVLHTAHKAPTSHTPHRSCCIHDHKTNATAAASLPSPHGQTPRRVGSNTSLTHSLFSFSSLSLSSLSIQSAYLSCHQAPPIPLAGPNSCGGGGGVPARPGTCCPGLSCRPLMPPPPGGKAGESRPASPPPALPPLRGKMSDSLSQWRQQAGWRGSDSAAASRVQSEKSFSCHYREGEAGALMASITTQTGTWGTDRLAPSQRVLATPPCAGPNGGGSVRRPRKGLP